MNERAYRIDAAFSFLAEDEQLAERISDLLKDRLSTFIYSKRQEDLVGTDGEATLNRVFGAEARVVVVLHRGRWGSTPWTRVEATAIRNRAYEEGYEFTVFIPLEGSSVLPSWLPKIQIWYGLDRWGIDGAASVIEARVQQVGGAVRHETTEDRAARLARDLEAENQRRQFLGSEQGVKAADKEALALFAELKNIASHVTGLSLSAECEPGVCDFYSDGFTVSVAWSNTYINTTESARVHIKLWQGRPDIAGKRYASEPKELRTLRFRFDLTASGTKGWRKDRRNAPFISTRQLAETCIDLLIAKIRATRLRA